uniref:Uncharacterized protein n=1 Tax=Amphimedon queenslandica TaxID=400682 RepID=A0A1X7U2L9_AMPQE
MNIFADQFSDRQDTRVFNNGVMQVSVFISVNYNGEASEDEIITYVQNNAVIYSLTFGENVKWPNSTTDNCFHHDIDHAANKSTSVPPKAISDIRVPLYFTVPGGSAKGEHRWIANLDGKQTSEKTPLIITVESFSVSGDDFEIVDKTKFDCLVLHVLKYKNDVFSSANKLLNCTEFKGIKFSGTSANTWVTMSSANGRKLGVFVEYRETSNIQIAIPDYTYQQNQVVKKYVDVCSSMIMPTGTCLDDTLVLNPAHVDNAWNEGVVLIQVGNGDIGIWCENWESGFQTFRRYSFECQDLVFQDTFGGRVEIRFNWNAGDRYGVSVVSKAKVVYP